MRIDGEHTTVHVHLPEAHVEDLLLEQLRTMADHPAFRNPIVVMPDTHPGAGSVVGFTMELDGRVVPNAVGVDVGCGMHALDLGPELSVDLGRLRELRERGDDRTSEEDAALERLEREAAAIDAEIREAIPFGFHVHDDSEYHLRDDFPWDDCTETLREFAAAYPGDGGALEAFLDDGGYDIDYAVDLVETLPDVGLSRVINSLGTLGGGNHFIELGQSTETGDYWTVVHSGSRKLGLAVARYHQQRAVDAHASEAIRDGLDDLEVPERYIESVDGGEVRPAADVIREELDGKEIERQFDAIRDIGVPESFDEDLAYLEGDDAAAYYIDMIFAQRYALESRRRMAERVADIVGGDVRDEIVSVHNFIDFRDLTIRKGATAAHEGERLVIPFNMRDGTIIARGKGNPEYNHSAPHGAGRLGSRRWAHETFSDGDVADAMANVFTTGVPTDEAPMAYKPVDLIEEHLEPTAEIVDRIVPVMNLKDVGPN